jgi:hypothetical protein
MRKLVFGVIGAASLASASLVNAAVVVTSPVNLTDPNPQTPSSIATLAGTTTIEFGQNPAGPGVFTSSFTFMNDVAGLYNFFVGTSTGGSGESLLFTDVTITGGGTVTTFAPPISSVIQRFDLPLLANTAYNVNITGTSNVAGAISGNVTIRNAAAVPEPATWALMILGFAGVGMAMRRRRRPVLAQIA